MVTSQQQRKEKMTQLFTAIVGVGIIYCILLALLNSFNFVTTNNKYTDYVILPFIRKNVCGKYYYVPNVTNPIYICNDDQDPFMQDIPFPVNATLICGNSVATSKYAYYEDMSIIVWEDEITVYTLDINNDDILKGVDDGQIFIPSGLSAIVKGGKIVAWTCQSHCKDDDFCSLREYLV